MALKLKYLQALKIVETHNPDAFIRNNSDTENKMEHIADGKIAYSAWKVKFNKEIVLRMRKLGWYKRRKTKMLLWELLKKKIADFRLHVSRIKNQYTQLRYLKDNVPAHDVIIKMDFAEDYRCQQEVQSAYWSPEQVTIHPMVFCYKEGGKVAL